MTNDEKLLAQALEALARFNYDHHWGSSQRPNWFENSITALRERLAQNREMDEAIAAGDGTLHGAIDYWQERALKAEARLAQKPEQAGPVQPNEVLFAVEIPEGYGDVHPELLGEDAFKEWVRWSVVSAPEPSAEPVCVHGKLWLWRNHVDGRPEYWAFENPFPVHENGDPQTLGEPCGYALLKASRNGRPDVSDEEVIRKIKLPKRTPLTDETLWEMWVESPSDVLRFARAIERKHGIGETK